MNINLIEYFEQTVQVNPDKLAVVDGDRNITFQSLKQQAVAVALQINKFNERNKPVAIFLPKSIENVAANIGVSYSGNIYMNLDVKSPTQRIQNIISLVKPFVIITNKEHKANLDGIQGDHLIIDINEINFNIDSVTTSLSYHDLIDTDPLCIINTSGSTGTPKAVVLNHKSFIDFTEWAVERLAIGNEEVVGSLSPTVFDIYSFELCMLMAKSSTIVIVPEMLAAFPVKIVELLNEQLITFIFWVPTIMVNIANMDLLSKFSLDSLKTVWFAGEVFPTKQFNYWYRHLAGTKFVNLYGPIEITLDCTYFIVDRQMSDEEPLPIGFPCRNTDVMILTDEDKLAGVNEMGELCVRGTSLAMGYYNNPEKTAAAFVQNPINSSYPEVIYRTGDLVYKNERGEIMFKGRKDSLIKHLGYRIELGEIEHVIVNTLKLVPNACVAYNTEKKEITLFYEGMTNITPAEFRKQITTILPKYMIPVTYYRMDQLPRNTNGKIDRLLLKQKINI
jgi:amino acid adenylation domain-containing protein